MEEIKNLFTRDNITLMIALIGCLGTIITGISNYFANRQNLDFRILGHLVPTGAAIILYIMFENKSRLPVSITCISVIYNGIPYRCQEVPVKIYETTTRRNRTEILSHHEYFSMSIPISLPGLGGTSGYAYFEAPEEIFQPDTTHLTFRVSTNRGKVTEKILPLGPLLD